MKIKLTEFALRHFDKDFGGTKILNITPEKFQEYLDTIDLRCDEGFHCWVDNEDRELLEGNAQFCKLLPIRNFTDARVGSMPITLENYQYLRSGYSARRKSELPVSSRWLELPVGKPKAEWLMLVLYDKAQIDKEAKGDLMKELEKVYMNDYLEERKTYDEMLGVYKEHNEELDAFVDSFEDWIESNVDFYPKKFDADFGVVGILAQSHPTEEPMKPETMLRNALGIQEGGNGEKLDRIEYLRSVKFWSDNATVK